MTMTVDEMIEDFELFDDWEDRYAYLIDLGKKLAPMPESDKNDSTKVEGCMSQVWMTGTLDDRGKLQLYADSDAFIVRGLIAVLLVIYNGQKPSGIAGVDIAGIFGRLQLENHLSPNRRNGFYAMVQRIQAFGEKYA